MENNIEIKKGSIETIVQIMHQLPEFNDPYDFSEINKRINNISHLNLVAFFDKTPVGFKLGYERDGYFYSWLGGVLPTYRRMEIAQNLANEQEKWAKINGYNFIAFKTQTSIKRCFLFH